MKTLLSVLLISMLASTTAFAHTTTTKQICKMVNCKQHCKTIKIHKAFKGTKVPSNKKK